MSRLASTSRCQLANKSVRNRRAVACAAAAVLGPSAPSAPQQLLGHKYAVLALGRVQQLVEEGNWYCCDHEVLPQQVQDTQSITFDRVVALKSDGTFRRGQPFLEGVTVEAEVLEEFVSTPSFRPQGTDAQKRQQVVSKFLVKKIHSSS